MFEVENVGRALAGSGERAYLREIGRFELLTSDQEVRCAQVLERSAGALKELELCTATGPKWHELQQIIKEGDAARSLLVKSNLRLVLSIARRYRRPGVAFQDLVQEGNVGLLHAAERFDWRLGFRFSTYATWWIRKAIVRALAVYTETIRVPDHVRADLRKVSDAEHSLVLQLDRQPTLEEIAVLAVISVDRVRQLRMIRQTADSLDRQLDSSTELRLIDVIADPSVEMADEAAARAILADEIRRALQELSDPERKMVTLRFGLDDGQPRTYEEVGRSLNVPAERAKFVESKLLIKLRRSPGFECLRDYLL